jgi:hypothetical protein
MPEPCGLEAYLSNKAAPQAFSHAHATKMLLPTTMMYPTATNHEAKAPLSMHLSECFINTYFEAYGHLLWVGVWSACIQIAAGALDRRDHPNNILFWHVYIAYTQPLAVKNIQVQHLNLSAAISAHLTRCSC